MIIDLVKAERETGSSTAKIAGIISTEDVDLQGEIVKQRGLDFSHFEKNGVLNYEHKSGAENVLGYPTRVKQRRNTTEIEGVLLLEQPRALEIYNLACAMEKAGRVRQIGFSVEGSVIERDPYNPHIVNKARVLNCAITTSPVNPQTSMTLIKSLLKGDVGYQSPSVGGEDLAPLVRQQLEATVNADSRALRSTAFSRIMRALTQIFPLANLDQLERLARHVEMEMS